MSTVSTFERAIGWIQNFSLPNTGIAVSSASAKPYPEVSGYFIPSLLAWGEKERALTYGRWLVSCQLPNGAWGDPNANQPFAFDTGQIIKGLLALARETNDASWHPSIIKACDWIVDNIASDGRANHPDPGAWGKEVPIGVLLYSFEAVKRAGEYLGRRDWIDKIDIAVAWLLQQPGLLEFTHLSHFHAYMMEALCDLGLWDLARTEMKKVEMFQRNDGSVPAFPNVRWVCSTGLLQYALVWYKLGDGERGDRAFLYASKLQNKSGGWFGSYGWFAKYFPKAEISWAVKYFLDALELRLSTSFERMAPIFSSEIPKEDGRYQLILQVAKDSRAASILDAGCGKGRYLRNLLTDLPHVDLSGSDISMKVMTSIPIEIKVKQGTLLRLPYADASFDMVYVVEALEHAVHISAALKELLRVLRPGGTLVILDKDSRQSGRMQLPDWEQWFGTEDLAKRLASLGAQVAIQENVPYEGRADGLFAAWIAKKSI